jgi:hypothetical protein
VTGDGPGPWVLVIGMHRSGTSALTGALGAAGFQLTRPDDRVEWAESNPDHWESLSLTLYDEGLLARLDGSWDAPPDLPEGWERGSEAAAAPDAAEAVGSAYPGEGPSLWKDPRLCLVLPFWREVLAPPLATVFVWRNPIGVARSLLHRDQLPLTDGLALWERYNRAGLEALDGFDTYVVSYESIVEQPEERIGDLFEWLASLEQFDDTRLVWDAASAAASIAGELRHHSGKDDSDSDATCLPEQRALAKYLAMSGGGHRPFTAKLPGPESPWTSSLLRLRQRLSAPKRELDAANESLRLTRLDLEGTEKSLEIVQRDLTNTLASTSWRVTAPLRAVSARVEKRRHPPSR